MREQNGILLDFGRDGSGVCWAKFRFRPMQEDTFRSADVCQHMQQFIRGECWRLVTNTDGYKIVSIKFRNQDPAVCVPLAGECTRVLGLVISVKGVANNAKEIQFKLEDGKNVTYTAIPRDPLFGAQPNSTYIFGLDKNGKVCTFTGAGVQDAKACTSKTLKYPICKQAPSSWFQSPDAGAGKECDATRSVERQALVTSTQRAGTQCQVNFKYVGSNKAMKDGQYAASDDIACQAKENEAYWVLVDSKTDKFCGPKKPKSMASSAYCTGPAQPANLEVCKFAPQSWFDKDPVISPEKGSPGAAGAAGAAGIAGAAGLSSGRSTIAASVVISRPATDAASCSAVRTTLVGSITPAFTRFS